jgi:SNF2 family DNA or RNA helicase
MQIVENRGLIFRPEHPQQIVQAIDKSAVLPDGQVLVHWNMKSAQALTKLGYPAPSAILRSYHYPGRDPAREHQKRMAEFMTLYPRCFNLSEMGTGKTRSVYWGADYLLSIGMIKRVLIVAPLSILDTAWVADHHATAMHRSIGVAVGDSKRRKKIIDGGCEFCIINHDGIKSSFAELVKARFDLIVIDEGTAFANTQTDRWKAMNKLLRDDTYLWVLTGTPAANSPLQAYGLAKLVNPDGVPKFFTAWKDLTMTKVSLFTYVPKPTAQLDVFKALQPAIRIEKKDCLQLPPVTYMDRIFDMDQQQAKHYIHMRAQMRMVTADKPITAVNSGVLMGKLMQIACGTVYSDDGSVIDFKARARLNELLAVVQECEHKVLVFAQYRHSIHAIGKFFEDHHIECATIDGTTPPAARKLFIDLFQNTDTLKVLVLQPRVASHGLTLTRASVVVWFNPVPSLEVWRQANDRINRWGQENPMTIVKLIGSPIERKVYAVLERRDATQTALLDLYRQEINS